MEQKKKKGAVLKGLAFPIGYTVFMNVVQGGAVALIAVFCLIRVLLGFLSATDMGSDYFMQMFMVEETEVEKIIENLYFR